MIIINWIHHVVLTSCLKDSNCCDWLGFYILSWKNWTFPYFYPHCPLVVGTLHCLYWPQSAAEPWLSQTSSRSEVTVVYQQFDSSGFVSLQGPEHPNAGKPFTARGFPRHCYLPDSDKGRKVRIIILPPLVAASVQQLHFHVPLDKEKAQREADCLLIFWNVALKCKMLCTSILLTVCQNETPFYELFFCTLFAPELLQSHCTCVQWQCGHSILLCSILIRSISMFFVQVLRLLLVAWDRRLIFSVGTSSTTGESDTVIWNEVRTWRVCVWL